jgi:hypothetical protein
MEGNVDRVDCNEKSREKCLKPAPWPQFGSHTPRENVHTDTPTHTVTRSGGPTTGKWRKWTSRRRQSVTIGRRRSFLFPENLILPDTVSIRRIGLMQLKLIHLTFEGVDPSDSFNLLNKRKIVCWLTFLEEK